jgi:hypothetical protein
MRADAWLSSLLARNAHTAYLRGRTFDELPVVSYEDLLPWIERVCSGEADVLFAGRPIAYERTSGGSGASKLIPYSAEGLRDIQRSVAPWVARYTITGSVYMSISPATRPPESIGGIPVGLPDSAYVSVRSAVPVEVGLITDVAEWRAETVRHLTAAHDLEVISVWSPTFLLRLLDDIPDPVRTWPRLRVVSCWASAASTPYAEELARRLPQAQLQPKGLMCTEAVVTIPDENGRPALNPYGYFEFERDGMLVRELAIGEMYEVIATTASGLYRYRTGDLVRYDGGSNFEFVGRGNLVSDLVGEKLTETFVARCLQHVRGFLMPEVEGYVLAVEAGTTVNVDEVERRLCENPQYAYARRLGQLEPLRLLPVRDLFDRYADAQMERGARLGDVKPSALWLGDRLKPVSTEGSCEMPTVGTGFRQSPESDL